MKKTPDHRPTALHEALCPRRPLPTNFTHRTLMHIEARRRTAERRERRRTLAVAVALAAVAAGVAVWTCIVGYRQCPEPFRLAFGSWHMMVVLFPVFALLLAFDRWLGRKRRTRL